MANAGNKHKDTHENKHVRTHWKRRFHSEIQFLALYCLTIWQFFASPFERGHPWHPSSGGSLPNKASRDVSFPADQPDGFYSFYSHIFGNNEKDQTFHIFQCSVSSIPIAHFAECTAGVNDMISHNFTLSLGALLGALREASPVKTCLAAQAEWDTFASPSLAGRILRVAALVDGKMLKQMLKARPLAGLWCRSVLDVNHCHEVPSLDQFVHAIACCHQPLVWDANAWSVPTIAAALASSLDFPPRDMCNSMYEQWL